MKYGFRARGMQTNNKIRILHYSLVIILGLLVFSCQEKRNNPTELKILFADACQTEAHVRSLGTLKACVSDGEFFVAAQGRVAIGSNRTDPAISVYDTKNLRPTGLVVLRGKGPGEVMNIGSLCEVNGSLWIYNSNARRILTVPIAAPDHRTDSSATLQTVTYMKMIPVEGQRYVGAGSMELGDKQFYLLDSAGRRIQEIDDYAVDPQGRTIASYDNSFGQQGPILPTPDGRHFMYASRDGLILKFFDVHSESVRKSKEYLIQFPMFNPMSKPEQRFYTVSVDPENMDGAESLTADNKYYYILFSDHPLKDDETAADQLLVFTHEGQPVARVQLDLPVNRIAYDVSDGKLYALIMDSQTNRLAEIILPDFNHNR